MCFYPLLKKKGFYKMTRDEAIKILSVLKAAYPNSYRGMTKDEANGTISVWQSQFANIPYFAVTIAVSKLISTNTFPPSIKEVKDRIRTLYWETWSLLKENKTNNSLSAGEVKALEELLAVVEPMRCQERCEPSIKDIMTGFSGMLTMPEEIARIK